MGVNTGLSANPSNGNITKVAGKDQQVQAPVAGAGNDRFTRQLGAMHEEQQGDGGGREPLEEHRDLPFAGEQRGNRDHREQGQGEVIEEKAELGHG
jgi:hypothetical protein